jgi:hypothetical protein
LRYALGRATAFANFDRAAISPHRAASDVIITAAVFEELIKRARWSELVHWSAELALHTRFHFGKYRGRHYDEIAASDPTICAGSSRSPRWKQASSTAPGIGLPSLPPSRLSDLSL